MEFAFYLLFLPVVSFFRICGEAHGQNAAGGGAAIGIVALYIAYYASLLSFVGLHVIDLIRYLLKLKWKLSLIKELTVLALVLFYGLE